MDNIFAFAAVRSSGVSTYKLQQKMGL